MEKDSSKVDFHKNITSHTDKLFSVGGPEQFSTVVL